jgi:hypothetical protein
MMDSLVFHLAEASGSSGRPGRAGLAGETRRKPINELDVMKNLGFVAKKQY